MKKVAAAFTVVASLFMALAGVPAQADQPAPKQWVHLGDSYGSGTGAGAYQAGTEGTCWRSNNAYAEKLGAELHAAGKQFTLRNVACSGATIADLYTPFKGEPAQLNALTQATTLATLQIGGNTMGFGPYAQRCLDTTPGADCSGQPTAAVLGRLPQVSAELSGLLREIQRRSPKATIVVVGYGKVTALGANAPSPAIDPICGPQFLSSSERPATNIVSSALDFTLRLTVRASGMHGVRVKFVSPYIDSYSVLPAFRGRAICETSAAEQAYHGFSALGDAAAGDGVFHLNSLGHSLMVPVLKPAVTGVL